MNFFHQETLRNRTTDHSGFDAIMTPKADRDDDPQLWIRERELEGSGVDGLKLKV